MKARQSSRKRNCPASASEPFASIFTRSKSLHRNRSGQARSDPPRKIHQLLFLRRKKRKEHVVFDADKMSHFSIKDLRTRRVFSPSSPIVHQPGEMKGDQIGECSSDVSKCSKNGEIENSVFRVSHNLLDDENLDSCVVREGCSGDKEPEINEYSDVLNFSKNGEIERSMIRVSPNLSDDGNLDSCVVRDGCSGYNDCEISEYSDGINSSRNAEFENSMTRVSCDFLNDGVPNSSVIGEDCSGDKDDEMGEYSDALKSSTKDEIGKSMARVSRNFDNGNSDSCVIGEGCPGDKDCKIQSGVDKYKEERLQSTPPDDIFDNPEMGDNGSHGGGSRPKLGTNNNCISKSKLVLHPCSRLKVFKPPSSFSYRRLLPYLMEIANDDSCVSKSDRCSKLENGSEAKPFTQLVVSQCEEILSSNCETDGFPMEHFTSNPDSLATSVLTPINHSCCDNNKPNPTSSQHSNESQLSFDLQNNCASDIEQRCVPIHRNIELAHDDVSPIQETEFLDKSLCSSVSLEASFTREENEDTLDPHPSVLAVGRHCLMSTSDAKPTDSVYLAQSIPEIETAFPSDVRSPSFSKGVLKRNLRGCRGLCTCLNCASFRLHAERAFEFSRNQMQDAEEVALELIKELSSIRNMLEKYSCGENGHAIQHINEVKEACRRASTAKELAKARLCQMNDDLNHHCRIKPLQRPRVKFADNVEERFIPKADLPSQ